MKILKVKSRTALSLLGVMIGAATAAYAQPPQWDENCRRTCTSVLNQCQREGNSRDYCVNRFNECMTTWFWPAGCASDGQPR